MPAVFQDHVIIVTGASEGIGRALCLALAPQKPKLVLAARSEGRLNELKDEVASMGATALVVPTDVSEEDQCRMLIHKTLDGFGSLDVLVNNAGMTMWTHLDSLSDASVIARLMRVNYFSAAWCTYYALPYLKQRKVRIVAVSSVAGLNGVPTRTAYAASKHTMFGFFDSLRIELMDTGVTVTMVAPDYVLSEIHRRAIGSNGEAMGTSPMQEDKIMTADACAAQIVDAMEKRERLRITSLRGRVGRWMKLLAPGLVDNVARKAIREAK
jgi:short-subunit dehydrogenase